MFDLPNAKRVRRAELHDDDDESSPSPTHPSVPDPETDALRALLNARIAETLSLPPNPTSPEPQPQPQSDPAPDPDAFTFRLFSTHPTTTIHLAPTTTPTAGLGGLLRKRPQSHYLFTATPVQRAEFAFAALTGEEVLQRSKERWWGREMPWRVVRGAVIRIVRRRGEGEGIVEERSVDEEGVGKVKRKRPGKKNRVRMRMRMRAAEAVAKVKEEEGRVEREREEKAEEKRKRMNRLKKLRKRAKKKEARGGDGEGS